MEDIKKKILIIMGRYLPGYKDGGPVRSMKNLVNFLGEEYDFHILTCDRDHGDEQPYPNIKVSDWNTVGKAKVFYVPPKGFTFAVIEKLAAEVDLVYVCGCFSDYAIHTLLLNRVGKIKKPVVVAAMGLFSPMEFRLKYKKKKMFTTVFNLLGMFKHIYWSATSELEISEIKKQVRAKDSQFFIAEDLPRMVDATPIHKEKETGKLCVAWISRIAPKKNLLQAIAILAKVKAEVVFTIYGPKHDVAYWEVCEQALQALPANIQWTWKGNVASEQVVETLKVHHIFLFPTLGENYGHVIQEALSAGCGVVLSDQTPWQDLAQHGVGYVFPVEAIEKYVSALEEYASMSQEELQLVADKALKYAIDNSNEKVKNTGYRNIFDTLVCGE